MQKLGLSKFFIVNYDFRIVVQLWLSYKKALIAFRNDEDASPSARTTVKVLRILRVLRPLKSINKLPKLKVKFKNWSLK